MSIPLYSLYGYPDGSVNLQFVHIETLESGNKDRDWDIAAHQHDALHQVIWVSEGYGTVELDTETLFLTAPTIIYVPPLTVHGFRWNPGSDGFILTIVGNRLVDLLNRIGGDINSILEQLLVIRKDVIEGPTKVKINHILKSIFEEDSNNYILGDKYISGAIIMLLVELIRLREISAKNKRMSSNFHQENLEFATYIKFKRLIDLWFHKRSQVLDYAVQLAVSPRYLHQLCVDFTGKSPGRIIQDRILLEAKRDLLYTERTIASIGYRLGFEDPAYFSRFFKRNEHVSPIRYRIEGRRKRRE